MLYGICTQVKRRIKGNGERRDIRND